jgi:hypothetical protein
VLTPWSLRGYNFPPAKQGALVTRSRSTSGAVLVSPFRGSRQPCLDTPEVVPSLEGRKKKTRMPLTSREGSGRLRLR